ncbi:MAG: prefoldin subunit beta [Candidatus Altiarchaeales archaeon IMC4]|nr:MAG: prefoldin subunit beta [Candidatus Altiarchaeales archaeon IMC4]
MEIPRQLQDKFAQMQTLQQQMQMNSMQKQQLIMQSADIDNALEELENIKKGKVYKSAGPLLVEVDAKETRKKLDDDKELAAAKIGMLEKQETKLTNKMSELRAELQNMMKGFQAQ